MAHRGHAHSVDFSPDGQALVSAGADGAVHVWTARTGQRQATLAAGEREVNFACYSPDGKTIAAAESAKGAPVGRHGEPGFGRFATHRSETNQLRGLDTGRSRPGGRRLPGDVLRCMGHTATKQPRSVQVGHTDEINSLAFSPDGKLLATASSDETVCIWDPELGRPFIRLAPDQSHVTCARFSPDGQSLATAGVRGTVKVWNVADWELAATFECSAERNPVRVDSVAFSPRDSVVAFGDSSGLIREWDWKRDRTLHVLESQQGRIMGLAYSSGSSALATVASEGSLGIWDFAGGDLTRDLSLSGFGYSPAFTRDSRYSVSLGLKGEVHAFDTRARSMEVWQHSVPDQLTHLCFAGSHAFVLHGGDRCGVYRWDLLEQAPPAPFVSADSPVASMMVTPDGKLLLTGGGESPYHVQVRDVETGQSRGFLANHRQGVISLACSPAGDVLASGCGDGNICLWDLKKHTLLRSFAARGDSVRCVAFSGDGSTLASAGDDRQVRLWDVHSGAPLDVILNHASCVGCVAFSPDEPLLVTGDDGGSIRFWSALNGEELVVLSRLSGSIANLEFSPDGSWLAAASGTHAEDWQTLLWNVAAVIGEARET